MTDNRQFQIGFQQGNIGGRLVIDARLDSLFDKTRKDFREGGVLNAVDGLVERFHINNFQLLRIPRQ